MSNAKVRQKQRHRAKNQKLLFQFGSGRNARLRHITRRELDGIERKHFLSAHYDEHGRFVTAIAGKRGGIWKGRIEV